MSIQFLKRLGLAFLLVATLGSLGCANMTSTERRVATGAGIGAVTGAAISGNLRGTAVGTAVGAGAGYIYDKSKKRRRR